MGAVLGRHGVSSGFSASVTERAQGDAVEARERERLSATETAWALREVNRLAAELDVELARRLHLRPLDHAALGHVMSSPTPLGPAELSARLGISTGSGTELVDRLEQAGHLQRRRDTHDRRRVLLHPSPTAVEAVLAELTPCSPHSTHSRTTSTPTSGTSSSGTCAAPPTTSALTCGRDRTLPLAACRAAALPAHVPGSHRARAR